MVGSLRLMARKIQKLTTQTELIYLRWKCGCGFLQNPAVNFSEAIGVPTLLSFGSRKPVARMNPRSIVIEIQLFNGVICALLSQEQ